MHGVFGERHLGDLTPVNHPMFRPTNACRYLPQVGMVTIVMNDYPYLKYALIGILGLLVVTNKEG